jgi:hypothetical protein
MWNSEEKFHQKVKNHILGLTAVTLILVTSCYTPKKMVVGVYQSNLGDSLRVNPDNSFKVEVAEPDSAGPSPTLRGRDS